VHPNNGKILFIGDNVLSDCYYTQQRKDWDTIYIMEELAEHEQLKDFIK